jgi:hypothetical protein
MGVRNCFSFSAFAVAGNNLSMHGWQYFAVSIMMDLPYILSSVSAYQTTV